MMEFVSDLERIVDFVMTLTVHVGHDRLCWAERHRIHWFY
jgi:hypothetical protein